jgi:hypothetical protein
MTELDSYDIACVTFRCLCMRKCAYTEHCSLLYCVSCSRVWKFGSTRGTISCVFVCYYTCNVMCILVRDYSSL